MEVLNKKSVVMICFLSMGFDCFSSDSDAQKTIHRADGTKIDWEISSKQSDKHAPTILVLQGSGCLSARSNSNIDIIKDTMPSYQVLTIEKYGVNPFSTPNDQISDCSEAYFANHTVSQRVEDAKRVITRLREWQMINGDLIILGGSEGGAVAAIMSRQPYDNLRAVVIISTGTGMTISEFFPKVVPPEAAKQMRVVFEESRLNPHSSEVVGGNSLKWWADIVDRRLSDDLLNSKAHVLIIHGTEDKSAPVESARSTIEAFKRAGRSEQVDYFELEGLDHHMKDTQGTSHMSSVLDRTKKWIEVKLNH